MQRDALILEQMATAREQLPAFTSDLRRVLAAPLDERLAGGVVQGRVRHGGIGLRQQLSTGEVLFARLEPATRLRPGPVAPAPAAQP